MIICQVLHFQNRPQGSASFFFVCEYMQKVALETSRVSHAVMSGNEKRHFSSFPAKKKKKLVEFLLRHETCRTDVAGCSRVFLSPPARIKRKEKGETLFFLFPRSCSLV